jgi:hypothetical protein
VHVPIQIADQFGSKTLLLGAFFVAFFLLAAVAVRYATHRWIRQGYLAYFFLFLLVVNLTGMPLFPFVSWYKFSEPLPETITRYEIRVADAAGDELVYDARATPPMNGPHLWTVGERMATVYDRGKACRAGRFFLDRARRYRDRVQRDSFDLAERVDFPRHVLDRQWNANELDAYTEFTTLRIYRVTFETAPSGRAVESYRERLALAVDGTVVRHPADQQAVGADRAVSAATEDGEEGASPDAARTVSTCEPPSTSEPQTAATAPVAASPTQP